MTDHPDGAALLDEARRTLLEILLPLLPPERRYDGLMVANAMPTGPQPNPAKRPRADPDGGWGEIRTHGGLAPTPVFKTGALNHSATHPL